MTLQRFKGGVYFPDPLMGQWIYLSTSIGSGPIVIDASGEKVGMLFDAPKTGNIDRVFAYIGAHTTGGTLDVRMETVDTATGLSSDTLVSANSNGSFVTTGVGVIDVTLTASAAVTKGVQYALVIVQGSPGNCAISAVRPNNYTTGGTGGIAVNHRRAHCAHYTAGAWASRTSAATYAYAPQCAFRYDDGNYYAVKGVFPISAMTGTNFNNTSTTRERGITIKVPFPATVTGFFFNGTAADSDCNVVLAATDGTALLTASLDKDLYSTYHTGTNYAGQYVGYFSSEYDLVANTTYYLTLVPQGASNVGLREVTLISGTSIAAQMDMLAGGQDCILVTRDSGGAYTTTASQRPYGMGVILDRFDDAAGGSATVAVPISGRVL